MRKRIVLSALAIMFFGLVNAQDVKYGVKGGLNVANFSGDTNGVDLKSRVGFNVGGFVEIKLSEKFALQPEVLYSSQGVKFKNFPFFSNLNLDDSELPKVNMNWNLSYVNIPVMFKYYVFKSFNIEVGPQIGILVSAKSIMTINGSNEEDKVDIKRMFKSTDFGLNLGAGYYFTENVSLGARYNLGLSNIAKTEAGEDVKLHNSVFSLSVGYKF